MKWKDIFNLGIKMGQDSDIRNVDTPGSYTGSYSDCAIISGNENREVNTVYVAVDAGVAELLLVDELNRKGKKIDGVIIHHPTGPGGYNLTGVVDIQKYNWERFGVDPKAADRIYIKMVEEENIELSARNFLAVENAARFLDIPVICMHTAIDNIVQVFFENIFKKNNLGTVKDVCNEINSIYEVSKASKYGDGPYIIGDREARPGNIMVDMTGGIDPDPQIFSFLKKVGVNTLIAMHYGQDNVKAIKESKINAVISGHMASDSIGINRYCDRLESQGLDIVAGAGLYRHRRSGTNRSK
ncbi:MAG TPA: NGG1p interacting factor NIF3 [Actinobacteria bacterium]|nr:NGG1p interacting factor NIF3 [Actinomycetota bacterium]